jgi:hypothetical protein
MQNMFYEKVLTAWDLYEPNCTSRRPDVDPPSTQNILIS